MEDIVDKYLLSDLRKIVVGYIDNYRFQYDCVVWEMGLKFYHRTSIRHWKQKLISRNPYSRAKWINARHAMLLIEIIEDALINKRIIAKDQIGRFWRIV